MLSFLASNRYMADLPGMSVRTYQDIENGGRQLHLDELKVVSKYLDVPYVAFVSDTVNFINVLNNENSPGAGQNYSDNSLICIDQEFM